MNNMGCIYLITNKINNMQYTGQTTGTLKRRLSQHYMNSNKKGLLSYAVKEFGKDNFSVEVLAETNDEQELNRLEEFYITKYNTLYPNGYNLMPGGFNHKVNEHTKKRISEKNKEHCKYIKIDKGMTPVIATNLETGEEISYSGMKYVKKAGFKLSCVYRVLNGTQFSYRGFTFKYNKNIKRNTEKRIDKRLKPILAKNLSTGEIIIFESITSATKTNEFNFIGIWKVLTKKAFKYKNFYFEYVDKNKVIINE